MEKDQAVLVTTEFRGVFYGRIKNATKLPQEIVLTDVRNCIYWDSSCKGFLGLASTGVTPKCRIGKRVPEITLYKVTSVTPVTKEAIKTWEQYK